jgi:hypothetical protein
MSTTTIPSRGRAGRLSYATLAALLLAEHTTIEEEAGALTV